MNYGEKKRMLESYGRLKQRCEDLAENIARLRSERERITPGLSEASGGGSFKDRIQAVTERLLELEARLEREKISCAEALCKAQEAIIFLESEEERSLLEYYYILGHTPEETAEHFYISERNFYRRLQRGIDNIKL